MFSIRIYGLVPQHRGRNGRVGRIVQVRGGTVCRSLTCACLYPQRGRGGQRNPACRRGPELPRGELRWPVTRDGRGRPRGGADESPTP